MKKYILPPIISFVAIIVIVQDGYAAPVTNLLIAGVIPGTSYVLPSFVMIALYCICITVIITIYVDSMFSSIKEYRLTKKRSHKLPHRRFGEI